MSVKGTVRSPAEKVLWYIESHFRDSIALDDVAEVAGVTRYHLSRVFVLATGQSITQYIRGRRLTEAARVLAQGAPDILTVALEAGYGSHEAFTRAFRDQFGRTPESVRAAGCLSHLALVEAIKMDERVLENLQPPRLERGAPMLVAGLSERYTAETSAGIPAQWQRFGPYLGHISGQRGRATYGVLYNQDESGNTEYLCGVEVSDAARLPAEFAHLRIPAQTYAVFRHEGHISTIRQVWFTIFNRWLPESGRKMSGGPEFERYGEEFNPVTGMGGFEIWIPLQE